MSYTGNYMMHTTWATGWNPVHDSDWVWTCLKGQKARPFVASHGQPNRSSPEISADEERRRAAAAAAAKRGRVRETLTRLGEAVPPAYQRLRG